MKTQRISNCAMLVLLASALASQAQEVPKDPRPAQILKDLYGDPLPQGAIARLGTVRFRHFGAVHAVAFSEDGKLLAASSDDRNMLVLWDRVTGRKIREMLLHNVGWPATYLRFSPDGKRLYASFATAVCAWDVETGMAAKGFQDPPTQVRALGYSQDSREMILLHKEAEIVRWDLEKGKELGRYAGNVDRGLSTAAIAGDRVLAPLFDGKTVCVLDAMKNKRLWSIEVTRHKNYPGLPMAFSEDGKFFTVEAPARQVAVYDAATGKVIRRLDGNADEIYYSLCFSPDARTIVGSNWDRTLRLWDVESGRERVKIPSIEGWVTNICFARDSKTFATGGGNNAHAVLLWDTVTGKQIVPRPGHTSPIRSIVFSPNGRTVATCSMIRGDPVVRLWESETGQNLRSFPFPNSAGVSDVAFSPHGRTLAACNWSGKISVLLWDIDTGRELHALSGHEAGCTCVAFSPDGKRLASGDAYYDKTGKYGGRLRIWDVQTGKLIREIQGTKGAIQRVVFGRDGRHVLAAANSVHVYDAETGKLEGEKFHRDVRIWGLALSPNGQIAATADSRGPVRLWDLATCREIPISVCEGECYDVVFALDGRTLVVNGPKGEIILFDIPTGETIGKLDKTNPGSRIAISPDGRRLATTGNEESCALIWDQTKFLNKMRKLATPAEADLLQWWADLRDPAKGHKAVLCFTNAPEPSRRFLAAVLHPVKNLEAAALARMIDDLSSPNLKERERASQQLGEFAETIEHALRTAQSGSSSAAQKRRIELMLADLAPEHLRSLRALSALEQIGGPEVRRIIERLASGAPNARLTEEARRSLERLKGAEKQKP